MLPQTFAPLSGVGYGARHIFSPLATNLDSSVLFSLRQSSIMDTKVIVLN